MPARTQFSMKKCLLTRQKPLNWAEAAEFPAGLTQQSLPRPEPSMRTKHAWRTAPHATQKQDSVQNAKTVTGWKADLVTYAAIFWKIALYATLRAAPAQNALTVTN